MRLLNVKRRFGKYCFLFFPVQICSLEVTCETLSIIAATLANGGVNPLTEKRILDPDVVRDTLSICFSCGMYDFSGQFAFQVRKMQLSLFVSVTIFSLRSIV